MHSAQLGAGARFAYGAGGIASAVKDAAVVHFLLMFYTQVIGLPGAWFGLASAIAQIADALIDPAIGSWSDNTRSRWGRRHPFMLGAAIPYAVFFWLLFNPPAGLSQAALFGWAVASMVAVRAVLALFAIPHTALGAELSTDYAERTQIAADRTLPRKLFELKGVEPPSGPKNSGTGRRIVYAETAAHLWIVNAQVVVSQQRPDVAVGRRRL